VGYAPVSSQAAPGSWASQAHTGAEPRRPPEWRCQLCGRTLSLLWEREDHLYGSEALLHGMRALLRGPRSVTMQGCVPS